MSVPADLPPQVRVMVRDWLNANNILLRGRSGSVLIDSGYVSCAQQTLALLRRREHLGDGALDLLVNTHCHSDHMGGNAALQRAYRCRTLIPVGEAPLIESWDTRALWLDYADQRAERFGFHGTIAPGDSLVLGDLTWRAIAAPGHDMGALVFYCAEQRILISGDALWENGFGALWPELGASACIEAARRALDSIATLEIRTVIPGHGMPFTDVNGALERALRRLDAFAADPSRVARHFLKVMLVFSLLDQGSLPLAALPGYLDRVPVYRDLNREFFRLPPSELAQLLVTELERAGAVTREGALLYPVRRAAGE